MDIVALRRELPFGLLTLYGLGNILGAGIYVLVGKIAGSAGLFAPWSFLLASLLVALSAFSYAELSARYPVSAGEAAYIHQGLGLRWLAILVGAAIILIGTVSAATIVKGFVGYFRIFVELPGLLVVTLLILTLVALAAWGILASVRVAALLTLLEIGGLLMVLYVGMDHLTTLPDVWSTLIPAGRGEHWNGILFGAFLAFFAFIGFEDMVNIAEEVRHPRYTLPLAILSALILATVLYLSIALVAVLSVPPQELARSDAPLAMIYQQETGRKPLVLGLISMFAVVNGALIQIIMGSRMLYGMSRRGWLPEMLGRVNATTQTPIYATLSIGLLIWILASGLSIMVLAQITSYLVLGVFALVNLALWRIKLWEPRPEGIWSVPHWIPIAGALATIAFALYQLYIGITQGAA